MLGFYESANLFVKCYFIVGGIGTIVYVLKILSSMIGADTEMMEDFHDDSDFKLFTTQTISLFMMGFGWMGVFLTTASGLELLASFLIASGFGVAVTAFEIWLISKMRGLEQIPVFDIQECVGVQGQVYLKIPENGKGEVQISVHGKRKIFKARSFNNFTIESFKPIEVVAIEGQILVVKEI